MAKAQTEIPGTQRVHHADIEEAADNYVEACARAKEEREAAKLRHASLLTMMRKHNLEVLRLADDRIVRVKLGEDKVKVEKPKTPRGRGRRRGGAL